MNPVITKYGEMISLLEEMKIHIKDLREVMDGKRQLNHDAVLWWTHAACAFNREAYSSILGYARSTSGVKVVLLDTHPREQLEVLKRALMYTDLIVLFSARPGYMPPSVLEGLKKGGLLCDGYVEWFHDLLSYKELLLNGFAVCVQKHYFDLFPERTGARWMLADGPIRPKLHTVPDGPTLGPDPYSLYSNLVRPSGLDCLQSGTAFEDWRNKLISAFRSVSEVNFATLLTLDLPYLENVPLDALVQLRCEEPESFAAFRKCLSTAVQQCLRFDVDQSQIKDFAEHCQTAYLRPKLEEATETARKLISHKHIRRFGPVVTTISLATNALLGNMIGVLVDSLSTVQQGLSEFLQTREERTEARVKRNELYLLWQLEKVASGKTSKGARTRSTA